MRAQKRGAKKGTKKEVQCTSKRKRNAAKQIDLSVNASIAD